jgi:hypothetical protein
MDNKLVPYHIYFYNIHSLAKHHGVSLPPFLPVPSAEIFVKYAKLRAPKADIYAFNDGLALLAQRFSMVLDKMVHVVQAHELVGFFWLHQCFEAYWVEKLQDTTWSLTKST